MTKFLLIFVFGAGILAGALLLNLLAYLFGFTDWYSFLKKEARPGLISYLWLFVFYPLGLGLVAYILSRFIDL